MADDEFINDGFGERRAENYDLGQLVGFLVGRDINDTEAPI
jgi:hypothetical protein